MEWTTVIPTEDGWYWACEDLEPDISEVLCVRIITRAGGLLYISSLGVSFEYSHFSHWMGPLEVPDLPGS